MGNQQCNECQENRLQSYAYGSHQIIHQENIIYAVVQKLVQGDHKLKKKIQAQLDMRKNIKHLNVVRLYKYALNDEKYGFKALIYYEYIPKTLRNRIQELKSKGQQITQRQLFSIIYGVQAGLDELKKYDIKHCCINMDTIVCKNNIYKITDVSSTTYVTSYDLVIKGNREQFLSQRLLSSIYNKSLNPFYEYRDDLFSLGMIILAVATNKKSTDLYNWNEKGHGTLNVKKVQSSLKEIYKKYSSRLMKKIKSLIYNAQSDIPSDSSTLTDNLAELDEEIARVITKAKKVCNYKEQAETKQCTPARNNLQNKIYSFSSSPKKI